MSVHAPTCRYQEQTAGPDSGPVRSAWTLDAMMKAATMAKVRQVRTLRRTQEPQA